MISLLFTLAIQADPLAPLDTMAPPSVLAPAPEGPSIAPPQSPPTLPLPVVKKAKPLPPPLTLPTVIAQPVTIAPVIAPRDWRGEFAAIRAGDWAAATAGLQSLPDDPLKPVALAEL